MGVGILSSALTGFGKYESGQQQKKAYDYNAAVINQNTNAEMVTNEEKTSARVGAQATAYAGAEWT